MRASRFVAALATISTVLLFATSGPASAAAKTTSGIATVTQTATVITPGFSTPCRAGKQNCAEIRTQMQVGPYMVLGGSFQQIIEPSTRKPLIDPATGVAIALNNLTLLDMTHTNAVMTTFKHKFNGEVLATAVSADHNTLYVGGEFTTVDGKAIQHLVAFSIASGATFGTILPVFNVANQATNNPAVKNANASRGRVRALLVGPSIPGGGSAGTLYVGGDFTSADGSAAQQLAAIDIASGKRLTGFTPNFAALTNTTLTYCGNFVTPINANTNWTQIWSLALSNDGSTNRLYVSGHFDTVDGHAQTALAAVNPATGRYDSSFKPQLDFMKSALDPNTNLIGKCYDILHTGNQVTPVAAANTPRGARAASVLLAQAGHFNCSYRFTLSGTRPAGSGWVTRPGGDSQSIVIVDKTVYVGGHFICWSTDQAIGLGRADCLADMTSNTLPKPYDVQRVHLAALDYDTGALDLSWAPLAQPSLNSPYYFGVWTLLIDSANRLWAGGVFKTVNAPDPNAPSYNLDKLAVFPVLTSAAGPSVSFATRACAVGKSCTFTASADPAPGSAIVSYAWNFGDGGTGSGKSASHTFTKLGSANVTVTVTDTTPRTSIARYVVRVIPSA
jgi:hypothetical protein